MSKWTIKDSAELYNLPGWGINYFDINEEGHVVVTPKKDGVQIDLREVMDELALRDVQAPVLLRFPDILDNRIERITQCYTHAKKEYGFQGECFLVYPVKVNQMEPVVHEIVSHGKKFNIGLEAGSKPELHAVIAVNTDSESIIVCNGYKDEAYVELALLAQKMGKRIYLVVEKLNEVDLIAEVAKRLNIRPNIGVRIKLAAAGSGRWMESGGDASKFGLTSSELLEATHRLEEYGLSDCLKLVHFHIGSQITNIRNVKTAIREAAQYYVQLRKMGFDVEFVDAGGGLGVDYDGTRSAENESSVNYSIQEYVNDILYTLMEESDKNQVPHPNVITESGRSLSAHHSMLVMEVLETATLPEMPEEWEVGEEDHQLVKDLYEIWDNLTQRSAMENWHDAQQIREEVVDLFSHGLIDLRTRAQIEKLFWSVTREIAALARKMKRVPDELQRVEKLLADKYFCNFSLFQSLPDTWAIDQIFPIMPLQRLDEEPKRQAILQDITCDSDGKILTYVGEGGLTQALPVHPMQKHKDGTMEPYYIGCFLIGAYQEILGDLHNLFGDVTAVHISVDQDGHHIDQMIDGETVSDVLRWTEYDVKKMVRTLESWVTRSVKQGKITLTEGKEFLSNYRNGLYGYTYLERE